MKKTTYSLILTIGVFLLVFAFNQNSEKIDSIQPEISNKLDKKTRADLANEHNFEMTKDPKLGYVPRERLWDAIKQLKEQERLKGKAAISGITWEERGPSNVAGRTRAIMFDPNDATNTRVFAGSVAGGLWVTDNIYAGTTSWTEVDEFLENLAVTSLAHHPTNTDTMYMATGEGYFNSDAVRGDGIFRSVDGGTTWSQLANTAVATTSNFRYVQKVVVDASGNVYAATRDGGVLKSTNHGSTWSVVLSTSIPSSGTNASTNRAADMEIASNGDIYVAMGIFSTDGIYKSTNGGTSWTRVYTSSGEQRVEIACAPGSPGTVYGVTQNSSTYAALNVLRTNNGGTSWTTLTPPSGLAASQAWYDLTIGVDPNDSSNFYIGGLNMWKSTNSGSSYTQVSQWYTGTSLPYVHADQHSVVYAPGSSDSVLIGNDGGVFLTEDGTSSTPAFSFQGNSYNVTQFYACAIHPTAFTDSFLAGSQDNGSHLYSSAQINATTEVTGGDGAYVHIDQADPSYMYTSYIYNQYRRSTNGGSSFTNVNFSSSAGKFINPTDYDNDASIMYCAYNNGQYLRWTNPRTGSTSSVITFSASGTGEPSAIMCDPNTANRIYIGTDDGEIWRINNANGSHTATEITGGSMSGYVSSIDVEDGDATHLLATFSSYGVTQVWESTNSGTSWTALDGSTLPDMPVRWGMFSPLGADSIFLATELGVWTTDNVNGSSTVWGASNTGLANVRTDMLQWRDSDSTLIAATHGRGLFSTSFSEIEVADFTADKTVVYPCETASFTDASIGATSWAWDFDNDGNTDATTRNPTWVYHSGGYKTVSLTINGSTTETKTEYITVLPKLGTPYTVSDGGNFETNPWHFGSAATTGTNLWERGSPSNSLTTLNSGSNGWKTDLDANCPDATIECHLYTPSFNMSKTGTYTLSFRKSLERYYGNAPYVLIVEYSTNSGSSWTKLGTSPDANGTNWYGNTGVSTALQSDGIGFLADITNEATSYNISSLGGNSDVRFRFTYISNGGFSTIGFEDGFMIDDFAISTTQVNSPNAFDVATALNSTATAYLGANDTVNFITSGCEIIATVYNLSSHDYGMTTVTVDAAGTGTKDFSTNTATSREICDKTILITPTTNNTSGSVKIQTYFSSTEASNWKTATGISYIDMNQIKSVGAIDTATVSNTVYAVSPVIDSAYAGNNLSIVGTYSNGFSGLGAGGDGTTGPLPLDLLNFDGKWENKFAKLYWTTANEVNVKQFDVERLDGEQFVYVGTVAAAGFSAEKQDYELIDYSTDIVARKTVHYRLKMTDFDGKYKYSKVVILRNTSSEVVVHPNPATNFFNVVFNSRSIEPIAIEIVNASGQLVYSQNNITETSRIDVSQLTNGIYFVAIKRDGNVVEVEKLNILH